MSACPRWQKTHISVTDEIAAHQPILRYVLADELRMVCAFIERHPVGFGGSGRPNDLAVRRLRATGALDCSQEFW